MKIPNNKLSSMQSFFLESLKGNPEAKHYFDICCDAWLGLSKMDRLLNKEQELSESEILLFFNGVKQLLANRPVQYVVGTAWFYDQKFLVEEGVLIPRPETEELVDWIINTENLKKSFVDVGTGSGCIPLTLKKHFNAAQISGFDVSKEALRIARKNAESLSLSVDFQEIDILDEHTWPAQKFDIVVSNPPYIPESDKLKMHANVLSFEPGLALFVPNEKPLLFYEKIADYAIEVLNDSGALYFEIHEDYGVETVRMLNEKGFLNIELRKDLQGKYRMVRAVRNH